MALWMGPCGRSPSNLASGSMSIRRTRSRVTISKSRTDLLYSGGLPAATMTQPAGNGLIAEGLALQELQHGGGPASRRHSRSRR